MDGDKTATEMDKEFEEKALALIKQREAEYLANQKNLNQLTDGVTS